MRFINEGLDDNPLFVRRRIGEHRESTTLLQLKAELKRFLSDSHPLSCCELDRIATLLQRGILDIQKKRRTMLLKKINLLKEFEKKQQAKARKLGVPRHK